MTKILVIKIKVKTHIYNNVYSLTYVVIIISRSCTKCDLEVKMYIKHVTRVSNLSYKRDFHLKDSILVHPQLNHSRLFPMGCALVWMLHHKSQHLKVGILPWELEKMIGTDIGNLKL